MPQFYDAFSRDGSSRHFWTWDNLSFPNASQCRIKDRGELIWASDKLIIFIAKLRSGLAQAKPSKGEAKLGEAKLMSSQAQVKPSSGQAKLK